ncbi:MAG: VCBS repeat-containing protein, partial [Kangiellaceae bacterium]|nr:VCBS repeat-containing protein [Kangiellaceae bacterium]
MLKNQIVKALLLASLLVAGTSQADEQNANSVENIVNEIKLLEKEKDPKCYATASRLEDFMFGTPLSQQARFNKNLLQKAWVRQVWEESSKLANQKKLSSIPLSLVKQVIERKLSYQQNEKGHWAVKFKSGQEVQINKDDKRQYSTIAYALRAILAVQQESLLDFELELMSINQDVINEIKSALELVSLSVLKVSDARARKEDSYEVSSSNLEYVWTALITERLDSKKTKVASNNERRTQNTNLDLIRKIIKQKVESYAAYNKISEQLFIRNLQVYFARLSWPKDKSKAKEFQNLYIETMIQFAYDFYKESEKIALKNGHDLIQESDVYELIQIFLPHEINEYEDAVFFPRLANNEKIDIESYDMDAFRDSGLHWRYLEYAINNQNFKAVLQPDPFALELIVENIAQFGVLSLRVAGIEGKNQSLSRINSKLFIDGLKIIQARVNKNVQLQGKPQSKQTIASSEQKSIQSPHSGKMFTDITDRVGVKFMHRSSDWLNRLLRSYLEKGKDVGIITIPPAFGGSGVAAEDINNDGYDDLLILSGLGNKLYLNKEGKRFVEITKQAGLDWRRLQDNTYGEPRQPIIADINNDGLQDIIITYVDDAHRVYKNLGGAKFEDVTEISNLGGNGLVGGPATVADFDGDGLLDVYITYFGHYTKGVLPTLKRRNDNGLPNQLFKNLGNFKFKNITEGSGTANTGWAQAVAHTDIDGDGKQDLIVGNDFGINAYLKNLGNNKFKNISAELGTDKPSYTMNIGIADLNQDLKPDIYISNIVTMNKDEKYVLPNENTTMKFNAEKLAQMRVVEANDLFLSKQSESNKLEYELSDAVGRGYSSTGWSWDADFFDYDNDSDDDLYVLNGMNEFNLYSSENPYYTDPHSEEQKNVYIPVSTKESNVFFVNQGGKLNNRSKESGLDLIGNSRSAAYLDFDKDGDLDIIVNNYHEAAYFYQNENQSDSEWIKFKL